VRAINKRTGSLKNIRNGLKSKELSAKEEKEFQEDQKKTCQELNELELVKIELEAAIKSLWQVIEKQNRVVAGGLVSQAGLNDLNLRNTNSSAQGLLATDQLKVWRPGEPSSTPSTGRTPLVIITVSGGGLRAAYWTFVVLQELETQFAEANIDFP